MVSDGAKAYGTFASKAGLAHVALNIAAGERVRGIYHVQNVNSYASRLKGWMVRFRGVATKYLDSYLGWYRANDREGGKPALRTGVSTKRQDRWASATLENMRLNRRGSDSSGPMTRCEKANMGQWIK